MQNNDEQERVRFTLLDLDRRTDKFKTTQVSDPKLLHIQIPIDEEKIEGLKDIEDSNEMEEDSDEEDDLMDELEGMQSPISRRKEITPELDEIENEFFSAFQEYREIEFYKEFNNYKSYYQDA